MRLEGIQQCQEVSRNWGDTGRVGMALVGLVSVLETRGVLIRKAMLDMGMVLIDRRRIRMREIARGGSL